MVAHPQRRGGLVTLPQLRPRPAALAHAALASVAKGATSPRSPWPSRHHATLPPGGPRAARPDLLLPRPLRVVETDLLDSAQAYRPDLQTHPWGRGPRRADGPIQRLESAGRAVPIGGSRSARPGTSMIATRRSMVPFTRRDDVAFRASFRTRQPRPHLGHVESRMRGRPQAGVGKGPYSYEISTSHRTAPEPGGTLLTSSRSAEWKPTITAPAPGGTV